MKLILKNIGLLEQAEITLHPLCVIAGENDNGKSTIGKVVFCIIKAINRYKEDLKVSKSHEISELLRAGFFELRRSLPDQGPELHNILRRLRMVFVDDSRLNELMLAFDEIVEELYLSPNIDEETREVLIELEKDVRNVAAEPEDSRKAVEQAFAKVFTAEFDSEVLLVGKSEGIIQLWENGICLIDLKVQPGNKVSLLSEVEPIEFKDATFVETPLILNLYDVLVRSRTLLEANNEQRYLGQPYTTLHTKDLFNKLTQPATENYPDSVEQMLEVVRNIIQGDVGFDRKARDFVFSRDKHNVPIKNTASGIKTFGVLQILLANDFINKNTLLVWDEPENHLHPKWQIKMAELLVNLAEAGVFIVVSVHSPYMIEALERFSEKLNIKDSAGFYLAKNKAIENKSKLEEIFNLLAEPFEVFQVMDAEAMRDE